MGLKRLGLVMFKVNDYWNRSVPKNEKFKRLIAIKTAKRTYYVQIIAIFKRRPVIRLNQIANTKKCSFFTQRA